MLCFSGNLSAQSRWYSCWGGAGLRQGGSETAMGLRYGHDLGPRVRVLLGFEHGWTYQRIRRSWPGSIVEEVSEFSGRESRGQMVLAFRMASNDHREWRLLLGAEIAGLYRMEVKRSLSGSINSEDHALLGNVSRMGGLRLGFRHARIISGPFWVFAEPWLSVPIGSNDPVSSPWLNHKYMDVPRSPVCGLRLGLELGPRSVPRPE